MTHIRDLAARKNAGLKISLSSHPQRGSEQLLKIHVGSGYDTITAGPGHGANGGQNTGAPGGQGSAGQGSAPGGQNSGTFPGQGAGALPRRGAVPDPRGRQLAGLTDY